MRDYAQRLRTTPAEQVISDLLFTTLNAAQVKLGRKDARLLIDLSTVMHDHARNFVSAELAKQIDQVLGQLRLGQVSAENRVRQRGETEPNDLDRIPTPPATGDRHVQEPAPASPPASGSSKLWVPGR